MKGLVIAMIDEKNYEIFRTRLKQLRDGKGLNSQALADYTGMSPAAISRYINGSRIPDIGALITLADFFGVRVEWMLVIDTVDRYEDVADEDRKKIDLYKLASDEDKAIIDFILRKYDTE